MVEKSLLCGPWILAWSALIKSIEFLDRSVEWMSEFGRVELCLSSILRYERGWSDDITPSTPDLDKGNPITAMQMICHFECTDPRDHIAAVLGLWPNFGFKIDYSTSTSDNYVRLAIHAVNAGMGYEILRASAFALDHAPQDVDRHLPSWVPDWRVMHKTPNTWHSFLHSDWKHGSAGSISVHGRMLKIMNHSAPEIDEDGFPVRDLSICTEDGTIFGTACKAGDALFAVKSSRYSCHYYECNVFFFRPDGMKGTTFKLYGMEETEMWSPKMKTFWQAASETPMELYIV